MIIEAEAKALAHAMRERYEHLRAITLIGRTMQKALFTGRPDEVVYWALVYAHFCGGDLNPRTGQELDAFSEVIRRDLKLPSDSEHS